jgi:hypothetical protein
LSLFSRGLLFASSTALLVVDWGVASEVEQLLAFFLILLLFFILPLLVACVDVDLRFAKSFHVLHILAIQLFPELVTDLLNTELSVEDLRLLGLKHVVELIETGERGKGFWLDFVLVGLLVERETVTSDGRVDSRAERCILFDDVTASAFDFNVFASFVHFTEHFDSLSLNLSEGTLFVFSLLKADLLSASSVFFLDVLFALDEGRLEQVESLVLKSFNVFVTLVPLTNLLLFHETASQGEASFVRGWREGVVKSPLLAHLLNQVHLSHGSWKSVGKFKVSDGEHLGHVFRVNDALRRIWVSLGFSISAARTNS